MAKGTLSFPATLSASAIRYLLAVREAAPQGGGVRSAAVAVKLGVSRPSVHKMMQSLGKLGLIHKDGYGAVFLTPEGERLAALYGCCFDQLQRKLSGMLPEDTDLDMAVCMLLSSITAEGLQQMERNG